VEDRTLTIHEGRVVERRELVEYTGETRTISLPRQTVQLLEQEHATQYFLFSIHVYPQHRVDAGFDDLRIM